MAGKGLLGMSLRQAKFWLGVVVRSFRQFFPPNFSRIRITAF